MSDLMYGSVEYFMNDLKTCVMNNLTIEKPELVEDHYAGLKAEIKERVTSPAEKESALLNLEKAYMILKVNLFGVEDEENGSRREIFPGT